MAIPPHTGGSHDLSGQGQYGRTLLYTLFSLGGNPSSGCGQLANNTLHGSDHLQRARQANQSDMLTIGTGGSPDSLEPCAAHWPGLLLHMCPCGRQSGVQPSLWVQHSDAHTCSGCTMVAASSS